ncbi:D-ribose pyranase [Erwinia psidii]|uniref:D-ribose pyranase n=1 Tax=Erwinia psidii TaxID=69224 RepID=A0A3N6V172_9GAMM|nr:D-ribose pyranase [Erwinia psidii]MCX8958474.1 D-ribose pyranase [Erwinia psidii]MCX8961016.1 D-ribose pyranase [Erwinia psidii]MCX8965556.1 D-ribose pyranase [Erwinia psidii]RQM38815.1 D-ribose pyranase [Erwinia psidii]
MKKGTLLNSEISSLVSRLGHTDSLVIGDAGLPVPAGPQRVDLALMKGIPGFMQVVQAVTEEMQVESVIIAEEMKTHNSLIHRDLLALLDLLQHHQGNTIHIQYVTHHQFKQQTQSSQAVIRSGECSPYANIILCAGVTF